MVLRTTTLFGRSPKRKTHPVDALSHRVWMQTLAFSVLRRGGAMSHSNSSALAEMACWFTFLELFLEGKPMFCEKARPCVSMEHVTCPFSQKLNGLGLRTRALSSGRRCSLSTRAVTLVPQSHEITTHGSFSAILRSPPKMTHLLGPPPPPQKNGTTWDPDTRKTSLRAQAWCREATPAKRM